MIYTSTRSKKRNLTKKQIAEYQAWLDGVNSMKTNFGRGKSKVLTSETIPKLTTPVGRVTPKYTSVVTPGGSCTKPIQGKVYTGTAMKGIGTLHKSNGIPIFSDDAAKDLATMRR